MLIRLLLLFLWFSLSCTAGAQNTWRPVLHTGDTLYLSRDLLPFRIELKSSGHNQYWDMGRLLSPFVHQSLVRPDINNGLILTGPDDVDRYLIERPDGLYLTQLGLPDGAVDRITVRIEPPVLLAGGIKPGASWEYTGTMHITYSGQTKTDKLNLRISARADASGEINTPTARCDVIRELRDIEMSVITEHKTLHPENLAWPPGFMPGRAYFFHSDIHPLPVAIVQTDALNQAKQVEYITQPWAGQVIQQIPRRPDIFVYPNPSFGNVRFDLFNLPSGYYTLEIYNILGMKLRTEEVFVNGAKTLPLDLSRFKKGTYIYRLVDSQQNTIRSKRLVIITP